MNGLGFRSWPDRFFLPPRPKKQATRFWIEFKRVGEVLTDEQARMQVDLRARGETVYACDNLEDFIVILEKHN